jgi:hypothetical protein
LEKAIPPGSRRVSRTSTRPSSHKPASCPAFRAGIGSRRATGKILAVVVYDSEEHIRQTDEAAAQLRQQVGGVAGVNFTGIETYEVIGQA